MVTVCCVSVVARGREGVVLWLFEFLIQLRNFSAQNVNKNLEHPPPSRSLSDYANVKPSAVRAVRIYVLTLVLLGPYVYTC